MENYNYDYPFFNSIKDSRRIYYLSKQEVSNFQNSRNDRDISLPGQSPKVPLYRWGIHFRPLGP